MGKGFGVLITSVTRSEIVWSDEQPLVKGNVLAGMSIARITGLR